MIYNNKNNSYKKNNHYQYKWKRKKLINIKRKIVILSMYCFSQVGDVLTRIEFYKKKVNVNL